MRVSARGKQANAMKMCSFIIALKKRANAMKVRIIAWGKQVNAMKS
jgi:hypothetical protein